VLKPYAVRSNNSNSGFSNSFTKHRVYIWSHNGHYEYPMDRTSWKNITFMKPITITYIRTTHTTPYSKHYTSLMEDSSMKSPRKV
jgi:hypothetical protein